MKDDIGKNRSTEPWTKNSCLPLAILVLTVLPGNLLFAEAPKVTSLTPRNGAADVSPDLTEIVVVFDQKMDRGGYSFTGGGPTFPKVAGKIYWKDDRTCVLPVQLEPGKRYELGINNQRFQNFKNAAGTPVAPALLIFTTAGKELTPIERLRELIDTRYSYREVRQVDWDAQWKTYEPRLTKAKTPRQFAEIAGEMLAKTEDPHIWLKEGGEIVPAYRRQVRGNVNAKLLANRLIKGWKIAGQAVATGKATDQIGYIAPLTWNGQLPPETYESLYEALDDFKDLPGIIIDARFNSGGDERIARQFAGCFIPERTVYAKHVTLDSTRPGGFSEPMERWIAPAENRLQYTGKVAVLTGPFVMSSAEAFLLMMKQAPNAKLIGLASFGSSGNPTEHSLGNGVSVFLPSWKAMTADGKVFEGIGIQPDIAVKELPTRSRDPVLARAIEWLK